MVPLFFGLTAIQLQIAAGLYLAGMGNEAEGDAPLRCSQGLPDIFEKERIKNADASNIEPLLAVIEDHAGGDSFDFQRLKTFQSLDEIHRKRPGRLDLNRREDAFFPDEQVDLVAVGVAEEIYLRPDPLIESALHDVRNNEVLIQITAQGIAGCLLFRVDAQQKGGETCIREKYFGGLDHTLSDIFEERRQLEHDIRRFQHGEPAPDGRGRYTHT